MNEEVLLEKINNLTKKVEDGFTGVHNRLDVLNGKTFKNSSLINDLQKEDIRIENKFRLWRGYWIITGVLASSILALLGKYVF